jgi:hypothetical protein
VSTGAKFMIGAPLIMSNYADNGFGFKIKCPELW